MAPDVQYIIEKNNVINRSDISQLVSLHLDSKPTSVLCHMGDFGCGDGGWTPVMKIDGNKVRYKQLFCHGTRRIVISIKVKFSTKKIYIPS